MSKKGGVGVDALDSKSARTRERILDSAAFVLSRKGFAGTRLSDVAEHAELQAPAIYYYFKSREILIEEVMYVGITRVREQLADTLDSLPPSTSPLDRILMAVDTHLRYILIISDYTMAAIRNGGQLPDHLKERHENGRREYGRMWSALFRDAQEDGALDPMIDPRIARMLTIGAMNWAVEWWHDDQGSIDTLVESTQRMILSGFLTKPKRPAKKAPARSRNRTKATVAS
ncbi:TetR/AcrR family transcriptional regulator [Rhodococcus pyridinivorans]|uniref:TetR/AcrR family transcriptional regulator n=1 Tax=Rhodococcus pyridinivorans TaxID=103816 RepID=UPI002227EF2F|nr:TetR/AcrR family transcriptional regulator [Rhodococcus pyridinivorans]MCW3472636.1 TetR/AcrR family transcriptional regulator [Rhodococcus pyridinivorans]